MEAILQHWELIALGILLIDKAVALSPSKRDDLIWTSFKDLLKKLFPGKVV